MRVVTRDAKSSLNWHRPACVSPAPQTLRVTPAMEAGLMDHVWSLEELVGLLETSVKGVAA
jgi:hypothetical protein